MATRNEKTLASYILNLVQILEAQGIATTPKMKDEMEPLLRSILGEEEETSGKSKAESNNFFYSGIEYTLLEDEERAKTLKERGLKVCEFTVTFHGEVILRIYWDKTLNWIMQPKDNGGYRAVQRKKFPCAQGSARPFLKKLAEEELAKPGSFAEKYYAEDVIDVD